MLQPIRNAALNGVLVVNRMPRPPFVRGTDRQHRLLGGSGRGLKFSPSPGISPCTVQPLASGYTVYAIPAARLKRIAKLKDKCVKFERGHTHFTDISLKHYSG